MNKKMSEEISGGIICTGGCSGIHLNKWKWKNLFLGFVAVCLRTHMDPHGCGEQCYYQIAAQLLVSFQTIYNDNWIPSSRLKHLDPSSWRQASSLWSCSAGGQHRPAAEGLGHCNNSKWLCFESHYGVTSQKCSDKRQTRENMQTDALSPPWTATDWPHEMVKRRWIWDYCSFFRQHCHKLDQTHGTWISRWAKHKEQSLFIGWHEGAVWMEGTKLTCRIRSSHSGPVQSDPAWFSLVQSGGR